MDVLCAKLNKMNPFFLRQFSQHRWRLVRRKYDDSGPNSRCWEIKDNKLYDHFVGLVWDDELWMGGTK